MVTKPFNIRRKAMKLLTIFLIAFAMTFTCCCTTEDEATIEPTPIGEEVVGAIDLKGETSTIPEIRDFKVTESADDLEQGDSMVLSDGTKLGIESIMAEEPPLTEEEMEAFMTINELEKNNQCVCRVYRIYLKHIEWKCPVHGKVYCPKNKVIGR
jgi:hypothetical protein